jgi:hypothetical protein
MTPDLEQRIEKLSHLIAQEQDRHKLLELAEEVRELLEMKRANQKTGHAA